MSIANSLERIAAALEERNKMGVSYKDDLIADNPWPQESAPTGLFNCAVANADVNGGNPVQCGETVDVFFTFEDFDGNLPTSGFVGLQVDIGSVDFVGNDGNTRLHWTYTAPSTGSSTSQTPINFTYGEPGALCTFGATLDICSGTTTPPPGPHDNTTRLVREFPGYGGEALNDSLVNSVYFMTNLNTTGPGSITAAPSGSYVVPLVAGRIVTTANAPISLPQNNIRFLGQLAPGHLSINGSTNFATIQTVRFDGSNALWEYFSIRSADNNPVGGQTSHKTFTIQNNNSGVVLSHLSLHYGDDDAGGVWYSTSDVTLYRLLIGHSAYNTPASAGRTANYGPLIGGGSSKVTMFQNVMMTAGRSPHIQNTDLSQSVNNLVYHAGTGSVSNQIYAFGSPARTVRVNFHDNLDVRFNSSVSKIWTGATASTPLEFYHNNNQYHDCTNNNYASMGFHSSVSDVGNRNAAQHVMPSLPVITDLTALEGALLPKAGNHISRDAIDDDVINYATTCTFPPVEQTASAYFADPWPAGPTKAALPIWDQASPDGLSDTAKTDCGYPAGTNLLSPNDGRWEAVVDYHSGGLLSASVE